MAHASRCVTCDHHESMGNAAGTKAVGGTIITSEVTVHHITAVDASGF